LLRRSTVWQTDGFEAIADFARAILASARSWVDESLIVMPEYRDRVVTVWHGDTEGGLNLTMSKETVDGLVARGRGAAAKLVARFAGDMTGITVTEGWRNQQSPSRARRPPNLASSAHRYSVRYSRQRPPPPAPQLAQSSLM
jgi:hypothetical protein